jgi:polyhydroxyalkanoate synthesis regulator phasin
VPGCAERAPGRVAAMAKKKDPKKTARDRADQVRSAVEDALSATADRAERSQKVAQERAQEAADELAQVFTRLRDAIDDVRPVTQADIDALRKDVSALSTRVGKLEKPAPRRGSTARKTTAARAATKRTTGGS